MRIEYSSAELEKAFQAMTDRAVAECVFTSALVGGVPAGEPGVQAFVKYQLALEGAEADAAVKRILTEEIGDHKAPSNEGDELVEREIYGINVIRSDEDGWPWIGNWQVKACLKAAFSRLGLFTSKRGSKGDVAEMGRVLPVGASCRQPFDDRIYLANSAGQPVKTCFEKIMGRVNTPQGSKSIVHWSEVAPAGTAFAFELRFASGRITPADIVNVFAAAQNIGLGSAKALERGKFRIERLTINPENGSVE